MFTAVCYTKSEVGNLTILVKTTSLPLEIKQSFWLHFFLHRHNILLPKGEKKTQKFLIGSDLRYLYHLKEFQKIV